MKEEFLHFVWNTRNFNFIGLKTTEGKTVDILQFGLSNDGGGPDFKNAQLRIDGTLWAGNIEMHLVASEWDRHGHSSDPGYNSVILHVVMEEDRPIYIHRRRLACIELKGRINPGLFASYRRLIQTRSWVPCQGHLKDVPEIKKTMWLDRMLVERLQTKTKHIGTLLEETVNDWHTVYCRLVIAAFGFGVNGPAFERLSRCITFKQFVQVGNKPQAVEALLFGCAGMLNRIFIDPYPQGLQKEFEHYARKFNLQCMNDHAWDWGRVRPANFPSIRIAQLAQILVRGTELLDVTCTADNLTKIEAMFRVTASEYWQDHSDFDRPSRSRRKSIGRQSVNTILINAVLPFLFSYGKQKSLDSISDRAVNFMAKMTAESNHITRRWKSISMPNDHAGHSQGLIHLKREYCDRHECTKCAIGHHLLLNQEPDKHV